MTSPSAPEPVFTIGYYVLPVATKLSWGPPSPNPPRKGYYLVPFASTLLGLSTLAMVLRFYARAFIVHKLGVDDILVVPGYLAAISLTIAQIISLRAGWGYHVWDFDLANVRLLVLTGYIVQLSIGLCCLFTKLSILLSYLRFAPKNLRCGGLRFWSKITMGFVTVWTVALTTTLIFSCNPPHLYWDTFLRTPEQAAKCIAPYTIRIIQYTVCSLNVFSDVLIMTLPIPTIWKLNMPRNQKWSCILIFLIWILATVAAILRLWITISTFEAVDSSWYGYDLWVYIALEAHLAVICACAPGIKPLITRIWPRFDKERTGQYASTGLSGSAAVTDGGVYELKSRDRAVPGSRRAWDPQGTLVGVGISESTSHLFTSTPSETQPTNTASSPLPISLDISIVGAHTTVAPDERDRPLDEVAHSVITNLSTPSDVAPVLYNHGIS